MASTDPNDPLVYRVNVGGTVFQAQWSTLKSLNVVKKAQSLRETMRGPHREDYFFDRDPRSFVFILNYVRYGRRFLEEPPENLLRVIEEDAKFFEQGDIVAYCKKKKAALEKQRDPTYKV